MAEDQGPKAEPSSSHGERVDSVASRAPVATIADDAATRAIHPPVPVFQQSPSSIQTSSSVPMPPPDFNPEPDYPLPSPLHGVLPSPTSSIASSTTGSASSRRASTTNEFFANHALKHHSSDGGRSAFRSSERSYSSLDGDLWKGSEASETLNEAREVLLQDEADWEKELENARSSESSSRRHSDEREDVEGDDEELTHAWDSVWPSPDVVAQHATNSPMRRTSRGEYEAVGSSTMSPPHSPSLLSSNSNRNSFSSASSNGSSGSGRTVVTASNEPHFQSSTSPTSSPTDLRPQGYTHRRIMSQDRERERRKAVLEYDFATSTPGSSSSSNPRDRDSEAIEEEDESPAAAVQLAAERRRRASSVSSIVERPFSVSSQASSRPIDSNFPPPIALPPSIARPPSPPPSLSAESTSRQQQQQVPPSLRRANSANDPPPMRSGSGGSPNLTRHLSLQSLSPKRSPTLAAGEEGLLRAFKMTKAGLPSSPLSEKSDPMDAATVTEKEADADADGGDEFALINDPVEATRPKREAKRSTNITSSSSSQSPEDTPQLPSSAHVPAALHLQLPDESSTPANISPPVDSYGISPPLFDENQEARPVMEPVMDVNFDDEGLNTLERIFLLSKSDFAFHRAYVARSLGDLLLDVDPCETVEYVMPLLSGFTMDEDESVKEAFASEIHKVLWFFFATCRLISDDDLENQSLEEDPETTTITITADGPAVVPATVALSLSVEASSWTEEYDEMTPEASTAGSTISSSSLQTPSDASEVANPSEAGTAKASPRQYEETAPVISRPSIPVQFFTPIIGSMLLSQNNLVAEPARAAVVAIIARLQGKTQTGLDPWGPGRTDNIRRAFASQTGPHVHDRHPFSATSMQMVERELIQGIVLGMGKLDTEMAEQAFQSPVISDPGDSKRRDAEHDDDGYPLLEEDETAQYKYQLEQEATLGRAISINLIASVSEFYTGAEIADRGFIDPVLKSAGDELGVKTEAALALAYLAKVAPVKYIDDMVSFVELGQLDGQLTVQLPLFEHFAIDDAVHVKQSACLCLPALCRRIESSELRRTYAVNAITLLMESVPAVQLTVLEILGEIIHLFIDDPKGPPEELLQYFLAEEPPEEPNEWVEIPAEAERDVVTAFNFPAVALTLGGDRWSELRSRYLQLAASKPGKVKRSLAASLHEMARILNQEDVGRDLISLLRECLVAPEDIRERVYDHLDVVIEHAPTDIGWEICESLALSWTQGTLGSWRIRERLAGHLPAIFTLFRSQPNASLILDVLGDALKDPFAAVRDNATKGVSTLHIAASDYADHVIQLRTLLLDLGNSSSFRQRQTFIRCIQAFIDPPPNKSAFEEYFLPAMPRLLNDVIDIRIALAKLLRSLFDINAYYGNDSATVPSSIIGLAKTLAVDEHIDVREIALSLPLFPQEHTKPGMARRLSSAMTDRFKPQLDLPKSDTTSNPFAESFSEAVSS